MVTEAQGLVRAQGCGQVDPLTHFQPLCTCQGTRQGWVGSTLQGDPCPRPLYNFLKMTARSSGQISAFYSRPASHVGRAVWEGGGKEVPRGHRGTCTALRVPCSHQLPHPQALPHDPHLSLHRLQADTALSQHTPPQSHSPGCPTPHSPHPHVSPGAQGDTFMYAPPQAYTHHASLRGAWSQSHLYRTLCTQPHRSTLSQTQIHKHSQAPAFVGEGGTLAVGTARTKEQGCGVLCFIVCMCVCPHVPVYKYWVLL